MQDLQDFSLRITVMPPEPAVDEHATTTPFVRPPLPGVSLRRPPAPAPAPAPARVVAAPPPPRVAPDRRMQRRIRARKRAVWAQALLQRLFR